MFFFEEHPQARSNLLIIIFQLIVWVKISIQETIHFSQFRNLLDTTIQKNYHNKIRLSQRNPCKIKVFLGCPYYTAISVQHIPKLWELIQRSFSDKFSDSGFLSAVWENFISNDTGIEVRHSFCSGTSVPLFVLPHPCTCFGICTS